MRIEYSIESLQVIVSYLHHRYIVRRSLGNRIGDDKTSGALGNVRDPTFSEETERGS